MGTSEKKRDFWGEEYVQHYDDQHRMIGISRVKKDLFGEEYIQHYDENNNMTGTSRDKTDFWGDHYVQHYDENNNMTGTSREKTDFFGNHYVRHEAEPGRIHATLRGGSGGGGGTSLSASAGDALSAFSGGGIVAGAAVACMLLYYAFEAWQGFVTRNEMILKMALEYAVPVLTMLVIAVQCAAKDKRLAVVGILEGAVTAALMSVTMRFGLEISGPVGDVWYTQIEQLAWNSTFFRILSIVFPFFMYLLIFLPFPVAGLLYRAVSSRLEPALKEQMRDSNALRIRIVCWISAVLFFVVFLMLETAGEKMSMVIGCFFLHALFLAPACGLMSGLAARAAGGAPA